MDTVAQLAGFIGAHAIWCVSDEGPLVPIVGFDRADGSRGLVRFASDSLEVGVAQARAWLEENPESVVAAVAALDGYYPLPSGKTDAVLLEGYLYTPSRRRFNMALPYRPQTTVSTFAVYRPKFGQIEVENADYTALANSFYSGVDAHEKGAEVWNAHLDQSQ
jgi:hypothetical protein